MTQQSPEELAKVFLPAYLDYINQPEFIGTEAEGAVPLRAEHFDIDLKFTDLEMGIMVMELDAHDEGGPVEVMVRFTPRWFTSIPKGGLLSGAPTVENYEYTVQDVELIVFTFDTMHTVLNFDGSDTQYADREEHSKS